MHRMIARQVIFEGRVQGVGFRYAAKELARGFEVCGWVKNLPDGTVELQISGEAGEVAEFIRELVEESPVAHHIKHHVVRAIEPDADIKGFQILR
jgi:acylphosphatase